MPFTISHIAAVLPLRRTRLHFTAMAIGAMSPDFSYVVEIIGPVIHAHTFQGLLLFCVPLSFVACLVFDHYLRPSWARLFPWLKEPPNTLRQRNFGYFLTIIISAAVGAASHILWDSFTHFDGYFVLMISPLRQVAFTIGERPVYVFRILQHGSSILGGGAIVVAIHTKIQKTPAKLWHASRKTVVAVIAVTAFLTLIFSMNILIWFLIAQATSPSFGHFKLLAVLVAFRMLGAMTLIAVGFPLFYKLRFAKEKESPPKMN